MNIPVESWYGAIAVRRSRRKYKSEPIDSKKIERLEEVCRMFRPFPDTRAVLVKEPSEDVFKGFIGAYGKVDNAPCYIAFIADMRSPRVQPCTGYTGEAVILEATTLGLATCWIGGFFRPDLVHAHLGLLETERVLSVTPVGIASEDWSFQEKLLTAFGANHKRKSLDELVSGEITHEWQRTALESARLAPSAVNRQPWRFKVEDSSISVEMDNLKDNYKVSKRLDCGIAMLHLEIGARKAGVKGEWIFPVQKTEDDIEPGHIARFVV